MGPGYPYTFQSVQIYLSASNTRCSIWMVFGWEKFWKWSTCWLMTAVTSMWAVCKNAKISTSRPLPWVDWLFRIGWRLIGIWGSYRTPLLALIALSLCVPMSCKIRMVHPSTCSAQTCWSPPDKKEPTSRPRFLWSTLSFLTTKDKPSTVKNSHFHRMNFTRITTR